MTEEPGYIIDWMWVFVNFIWILGFACLLACWSHYDLVRHYSRSTWRQIWQRPDWILYNNLALALICLGFTASNTVLWQKIVWGALLVSFLWQATTAIKLTPVNRFAPSADKPVPPNQPTDPV
jgi:hypothetical protein